MEVNILGLVAIIIFYAAIAIAGIWAARVTRKRKSTSESETITVGARDIGIFLGFCTMSATWVGGAEINGTAESVYDPQYGLLWAFALPGYSIGLMLNALFFVKKMRDGNYTTTLDPFQAKLGKNFGLLICLIEVVSGILFTSAILTALGGTLEVVVGISKIPAILVSAAISVFYTILGGLYSVAYTDVIQLFIMIAGLVLAVPFVLTNDAVGSIIESAHQEPTWLGTWNPDTAGSYIDIWMLVLCGGIPFQVVYQRVFAASSTKRAQIFMVGAGLFSIAATIPSVLIGAAGVSTNWTMTSYMNGSGVSPADVGDQRLILPIALQYLTPPAVAFLGLGAVSAGVMSSMDSALLAMGSVFGRNIYQKIIRKQASEREVVFIIRITIFLTGAIASAIAISLNSVMALLYFCVDFSFVVNFPLFASLLYLDPNVYGSAVGVFIGLLLRLGGGDYLLNWQPLFHYPGGDNFPIKTVSSVSTFISVNVLSYFAKILFEGGYISEKYDFLHSNLAHGGRTIYLAGTQRLKQENRKTGKLELESV